jgi:cobalt-zinc-cadmium efflux system membrane fusion protein
MNRIRSWLFLALSACASPCGGEGEPTEGDGAPPAEHRAGEPHVVELTPEAVTAARLKIEPATEGTLADELDRPGRVALSPEQEAVVSSSVPGQLSTIKASVGEEVGKGQVLGAVRSPEVAQAVADYRADTARHEAAEARLERLRGLEKAGVSSRAQVIEAEATHTETAGAMEAAEQRLRVLGVDPGSEGAHGGRYGADVAIDSPIAGEVLTVEATAGQMVQPGDALFRVGRLDTVWVLVDAAAEDIGRLHVGEAGRFVTDAWPGETFDGQIDVVGSWVDPDARTVEVRMSVPNPERKLKPNLFGRVVLAGTGGPAGIVVPAAAVQEIDGGTVVFVQTAPRSFVARPVVVGRRSEKSALIAEGLAAGDPVVVEGAFALKSELGKSELGEDE